MATQETRQHHNRHLGQIGEEIAAKFLIQNGYSIVDRNWRTRYGEIDIIAQKDRTICFIEVKTRSNIGYGYPVEAITPRKLHKMNVTAQLYCLKHRINLPCKLIVIEVIKNSCHLIEIE